MVTRLALAEGRISSRTDCRKLSTRLFVEKSSTSRKFFPLYNVAIDVDVGVVETLFAKLYPVLSARIFWNVDGVRRELEKDV